MPATHVASATALLASTIAVPAAAAVGDRAVVKVFRSRQSIDAIVPAALAPTWGSGNPGVQLSDDPVVGKTGNNVAGLRMTVVTKVLEAGDLGASFATNDALNYTELVISIYRDAGVPTVTAARTALGMTLVNSFATTLFEAGAIAEYVAMQIRGSGGAGGSINPDGPGPILGSGQAGSGGASSGTQGEFGVTQLGDGFTMAFTPGGRTLKPATSLQSAARIVKIPPAAAGVPALNAGSPGPAWGDRLQSAGISRRVRVPLGSTVAQRATDRVGGKRRVLAAGRFVGPNVPTARVAPGNYSFELDTTTADHAAAWEPGDNPVAGVSDMALIIGAGRRSQAPQVPVLALMAASLHMDNGISNAALLMGIVQRGPADVALPAPTYYSVGRAAANIDTCHRGIFGQRLFLIDPGSEVYFYPAFSYVAGAGTLQFDQNDMLSWAVIEL